MQSSSFRLPPRGNEPEWRLNVAAIAERNPARAGMLGVSDAHLFVWDEDCDLVHRQTFGDATQLRFEEARLGETRLLHVVARYPGGSDIGYRHFLIEPRRMFDFVPLAPVSLFHNSMGGFFVGDLGGGRGPGIALWNAEWPDGAHYDPHPAEMLIYQWRDGAFVGPERLRTRGRVAAEPNAAPAALGLTFRDSTAEDRFLSEFALVDNSEEP